MDKSHDSLVMGSPVRVGVQPMTIKVGDEVQKELLSVPFHLSKALHGKVPILSVTTSHEGVIGLDHLQKGKRNKSAPSQKVEKKGKCVISNGAAKVYKSPKGDGSKRSVASKFSSLKQLLVHFLFAFRRILTYTNGLILVLPRS